MTSFSNVGGSNATSMFSNHKPFEKEFDEVIDRQSRMALEQMQFMIARTASKSEESEASNAVSLLQDQLTKNVYFINSEGIADILFLSEEHWHSTKKSPKSLQAILGLTLSENTMLQVMFKKCHFSQSIRLFELLGFELYQQIMALSPVLSKSKIDQVLYALLPCYFSLYLRLNSEKIWGQESAQFPQIYLKSREKIQQNLMGIKTLLRTLSNEKQLSEMENLSKITNPTLKARTTVDYGKRFEQNNHLIARPCQTIDLFLKILTHPEGSTVLMDNKLFWYLDKESLPASSCESYQKNMAQLALFAAFCEELFRSAEEKGYSSLELHPLFESFKNHCIKMKEGSIQPEAAALIKNELNLQFCSLAQSILREQGDHQLTESGQLTYAVWQKRNNINDFITSQDEFIEYMRASFLTSTSGDYFLSFCENIFDSHILPPFFPRYSPSSKHLRRFALNTACCPEALPLHEVKNPLENPFPIVAEFENYFCEMIGPIEAICQDVIHDQKIQSIKTGGYQGLLATPPHAVSKNVLYPLEHLVGRLEKIKSLLSTMPEKLSLFLKERLAQLHPEISPEDKERICAGIQEVCLKKSLFLLQMTMIMDDVKAILYPKFSPEAQPIIPELANIIILSDLDECFPKNSEFDPEVSETASSEEEEVSVTLAEAVLASMTQETKQPLDLSASTPFTSKSSTAKISAKTFNKQKNQPKTYPALPPEFVYETKTRKIIAMLRKCGFIKEIQSKHLILEDAFGRTVPIPRREEQCRPTVHSMYYFATAPLRES